MLFTLLLPLFILSVLGYLLAKSNWLADAWFNGVNKLTAKLLIPALLFNGAYKNGLPEVVSWQVFGANLSAVCFALANAASSVLVILAACPIGVNVSAVVQSDSKDPALVNSSILLSCLTCVATIPMWLWVLSRVA